MKNLINLPLSVASLLLLFIIGCQDDDVKSPEELKAEKVAVIAGTEGKSWELLTAISGGFDFSQLIPSCDRDNIYHLKPSGEGEYRSGPIKCEEGEADVLEVGTWNLSDDFETLSISIGMLSNDSKILELSEDRLKLEFTSEDGQVVVATFKPAD